MSYLGISRFKGSILSTALRTAGRYQRGNQNPYIEEEQTTQRPKEKVYFTTKQPYDNDIYSSESICIAYFNC